METLMTHDFTYSTTLQKATLILGSSVVTPDGESLGDIRDIVLDPSSGRVSYCVVAFGGIAGFGRKLFAIPFNALGYDLAENEYVLDISKQRMLSAPGFDANRWPAIADTQWGNGPAVSAI
jgi:sporulation protein YlmC with PRC-barrel domain